ncbi:MAG: SIMPL domain-containing protein [Candidatus Harrisonbacteria bacterium]|nr:SIMPL domain-containing protein [Candidatus Harrisonbacteria bacterium]
MDSKIKNYLGWAGLVLMSALALSVLSYVRIYSRSVEPSTFRSFTVNGEGKAVAIPDVAQFTFSVLTQGGKNLGELQKENTTKINRAIGVIKAAGVQDKDVKTESYSVEPRYQYFNCGPVLLESGKPCPPPEIVGYTVSQTVSVKVRDFAKIGDLLRDAVESGANTVSQLSFTVDDQTEIQNQARAEAIQKAKAKAKTIAKAGGFRLGKLLSIEEGGGPIPVFYKSLGAEAFSGAVPAVAPSIEPGSQEVRVTITLRYEIR